MKRAPQHAIVATVLLALSLALGAGAARWFTLPNLIGFSGQNVEIWCWVGL